MSYCFRNVIVKENAKYTHILLGKGSASILDESRISTATGADIDLLGCLQPRRFKINCIVHILSEEQDYKFSLEHRHILDSTGKVEFIPIILGELPLDAQTNVSVLSSGSTPADLSEEVIANFLVDIVDLIVLERMDNVERFYKNKELFLKFG